ncbi:acyltransferase [Pseudoxanthomonas broegbernensis]|uniref:Acyltransferase n=1 Tax=Pseudoxanthomonas broegbernensis TaxID=83619 RepID=A0A7V8K7E0_9GAMM|nr:lysophospholipid acyltransferase family protein [Pseudoxanthomonas broegbernensis]KAF1687005.1 acyltransferase [Pseudoxanthomonas broegbernensis]MBB6065379.1 1-acyl-sn-glycerol-3-phosphate acyltransferase [Pseudoxanthomonas broegbernensis]
MAARAPLLPAIPPSMPQVGRQHRLSRWIGRSVLRVGGWRVAGTLPDVPRLVLIAAPHSSNWDGVWGMAAKLALGFDVRVLGKDSLFWWPLSPLLHRLGVIPVDRSRPQGVVEQAVEMIRDSPRMWFALTPEGTRSRVARWKSGFWKIADAAQVPVLMAYFHYPERTIGIGPLFRTTGDMQADMAAIRAWYRPWMGRNRGTV